MRDYNDLYYISIRDTKVPLLLGERNIALMYDDEKKAEEMAEKLNLKYMTAELRVELADKEVFFSMLDACGIKIRLNNKNFPRNASKFAEFEPIKQINKINYIKSVVMGVQPDSEREQRDLFQSKMILVFLIILLPLLYFGLSLSDLLQEEEPKYTQEDIIKMEKKIKERTEKIPTYEERYTLKENEYMIPSRNGTSYNAPGSSYNNSESETEICSYTSDVPYSKGTLKNEYYYRSKFIKLYAKAATGSRFITEDELNSIFPRDNYQPDWEIGAKGKNNEDGMEGVFTLKVGYDADYMDCLNVILRLSSGFGIPQTDGKVCFGDSVSGYSSGLRKYHRVVFTSYDGIIREFYFNKVNDRLVCVVNQYNKSSGDESIFEFNEVISLVRDAAMWDE